MKASFWLERFLLLCSFRDCSTNSELKASPHDVNSHTPMTLQRFSWAQSKCGLRQTMEQTVRPTYKGLGQNPECGSPAGSPAEEQKALKSQGRRWGWPSKHLLLITVQSQHSLYTVNIGTAKFTYPKLTPLLLVNLLVHVLVGTPTEMVNIKLRAEKKKCSKLESEEACLRPLTGWEVTAGSKAGRREVRKHPFYPWFPIHRFNQFQTKTTMEGKIPRKCVIFFSLLLFTEQ